MIRLDSVIMMHRIIRISPIAEDHCTRPPSRRHMKLADQDARIRSRQPEHILLAERGRLCFFLAVASAIMMLPADVAAALLIAEVVTTVPVCLPAAKFWKVLRCQWAGQGMSLAICVRARQWVCPTEKEILYWIQKAVLSSCSPYKQAHWKNYPRS